MAWAENTGLDFPMGLDSRLISLFKSPTKNVAAIGCSGTTGLEFTGIPRKDMLLPTMPWEHRTEPLATRRIFTRRMLGQLVLVMKLVAGALVIGIIGYMLVARLGFVDALLEASMLLSGAGPLYTERSSSNALKIFSSLYSLFGTLVVVSSVGILAAPIIHRVLHRMHMEREQQK